MSSSKTAGSQIYTVTHSAPLDEESVAAGVVEIDGRHVIRVVSAEPDFAEDLELAAEMVNSSDKFMLHLDDPDATSRVVRKQVVPRDATNAREALVTLLQEKYGYELTPKK